METCLLMGEGGALTESEDEDDLFLRRPKDTGRETSPEKEEPELRPGEVEGKSGKGGAGTKVLACTLTGKECGSTHSPMGK